MTCYLRYLDAVKRFAKVGEADAKEILESVAREEGHNLELIKAVVDFEKENLRKRLRKKAVKEKAKEEQSLAYA
ncbi:hypothetical protein HYS54_00070 [Candidatus Micrarchaeota archaeon]|nr:hypothetical protein [Candidatus Micrarchaeota archaeon]